MRIAGQAYSSMSLAEIECIHRNMLRILSEMGMIIQNRALLDRIADAGLEVDFEAERVRFPHQFVEAFLSEAEKYDWDHHQPSISASAGVYHSKFHDPATNTLTSWTEESLAFYFGLARQLPHIGSASMLGNRLLAAPQLEPLYERYYCWKYGAVPGGSIYLDEVCPYLLDLYQARSDVLTQSIQQVFHATVYLVPALKLGRHEAYQVVYFLERGLHVGIGGSMLTMGADAPVTLAGAVTLNLAEQIALRILEWIFGGIKRLHIGSSISVLDMRTTIRPFGRPEMPVANLMTAQLARYYGASFSGHAGLTDAKLPSVESGAQKMLSAVPTLLAGGSLWVDAGLMAVDEVCSPIQMVLDNEMIGYLKHFTREFEVSDGAVGLETILEAGPGGFYIDKPHTAQYFRAEHWNPTIWSRQMLGSWIESGSKLDIDRAREMALAVKERMQMEAHISNDFEAEMLRIIRKAERELAR